MSGHRRPASSARLAAVAALALLAPALAAAQNAVTVVSGSGYGGPFSGPGWT